MNKFPDPQISCFNFGTCLSAMFRALGIPGRCQHTMGGDGWISSFHVWAEAFLDQPEIHPNDPGWWGGYWYEFDCNDPYYATDHTTSHSEGSITPIVINSYGDYLINEYIQCEGIGYDGSFYTNSSQCTPPGRDTGTHTAVPLQSGTANDAEEHNSYPMIVEYDVPESAWQLMNLFVPYNGPAQPSGDPYVYDSHHGYALNDTQTGADGGLGYIPDSTAENDLPVLVEGVPQPGVIGGWGFMMYRVPVNGSTSITALSGMYVYYTGTTSIADLRVGTKHNNANRYWASAVKYDLPAAPVAQAVIKLKESSTMFCDSSDPGDIMQISRSAVQFDNIPGYGGIPAQVGTVKDFSVTGCVQNRVTGIDITAVVNEAIQNGENTLLIRYKNFNNDGILGQHRFYQKPELDITPQ